jgi:hypothetical protein
VTVIDRAGRPETVTVITLGPDCWPKVTVPTDVGPALAVCVGELVTFALPLVTVTVTGTPPRLLPCASLTTKVGDGVRTDPAVPENCASLAAATEAGTGWLPVASPPHDVRRRIADPARNAAATDLMNRMPSTRGKCSSKRFVSRSVLPG